MTTAPITSVWSAFGHRFISEDESCLTCGAVYELTARADDPTAGDYHAANGDDPQDCSRDTSMAHGYPGERDDAHGQHNVDHDCNCLLCDS